MNSAELAATLGDGWVAGKRHYPASAAKGHCRVQATRLGFYAAFDNQLRRGNATARTPQEAVRSCLRGIYQLERITLADLEAVLPGVTE